ncbi:MAG: thioredoxin [Lachnospiraceae bacterium]|nr:thioredoxin [Lachnospiraceae bacterium]
MEYQFNDNNFRSEVLESNIPVLVDFYADWCGPCHRMAPIVEELAAEFDGKIKIGKLNIDNNQTSATNYDVMSIPNFVFFKDGKVVNQVVGGMTKDELKAKLEALL